MFHAKIVIVIPAGKPDRFTLNDGRYDWELVDCGFHLGLKRRWQWHGDAGELLRKHQTPHFQGKVAAAVNNRQNRDSLPQLQGVQLFGVHGCWCR